MQHSTSQRFATSLLVFSVLGILWFGLQNHGFHAENQAYRDSTIHGIRFTGSGYAVSDEFSIAQLAATGGVTTILLSILPDERSLARRFQFILALGDDNHHNQFIIAQWIDKIIVMRGDDYDYADRDPRLTARFAASGTSQVLLAVRMTPEGSELRINNEVVATLNTNLAPLARSERLSLRLGESADLNKSWRGAITGLAVFDFALSDESLTAIYQAWTRGQDLTATVAAKPALAYDFAGGNEREIPDVSGNSHTLHVPELRSLQQPQLAKFTEVNASAADVILNLLGFIPLGFSLAWLLKTRGLQSAKRILLVAIAVGFLLSAGIELTQAWMPARTPSLLDLLLNTAGTTFGALAFCWLDSKISKPGGRNLNTR